jgi:Response regulator containing CheY-like receiver, AAA-type ATPase, and DNA-binding domains
MAKSTIIVADDDEMVREVLARQLMAKGYDVRSAADGAEAWEMFQKQPGEILMTDLDMPRMTGQELIAKVKQHSPAAIVIVMTGHGTLDSARKIIQLGCDEYLLKPVEDIDEVDLVLKRSLERRRMLMQSIVSKRVNMAKSKMIHDLSDDLVGPTHGLLNSIDTLIGLIKDGDSAKTLAVAEGIKKNVADLSMVVGKLAESSDRLKTMEG